MQIVATYPHTPLKNSFTPKETHAEKSPILVYLPQVSSIFYVTAPKPRLFYKIRHAALSVSGIGLFNSISISLVKNDMDKRTTRTFFEWGLFYATTEIMYLSGAHQISVLIMHN